MKSMSEVPKIYVDRGARSERSLNDNSKPIRKAFLTCPGVQVVESTQKFDGSHPPTLVYLISQTEHPGQYEQQGLTVYPSSELVEKTSNKQGLHNYLRGEHIPTPPTLHMPYEWLSDDRSLHPMHKIAQAMKYILKPKHTFTDRRAAELPKHYPDYLSDRSQILEDEKPYQTEMILQPNKGKVVKVFGCLPSLFFYEDEAGNVIECPPNIKRTCQKIFEDFDMPFGGIDFVTENNVLWQVIDVNPTTGGRTLPSEFESQFEQTMHQHILDLVSHKKKSKTKHEDIQVVVAAGGESSRMTGITAGPKALLQLGGQRILDYSLHMPKALAESHGFHQTTEIVVQPKHEANFREWQNQSSHSQHVDLIPSPVKENKSSYTDVIYTQPESGTNLVVQFAADRIYLDIPDEELKKLAEQLRQALAVEHLPFVIVGIRDDSSKYLYEVDTRTHTIVSVFTKEELDSGTAKRKFSEGVTQLLGIKKICYGWNMAKVTVIKARNTTEMTRMMLDGGCPGKMILLPEAKVVDIDEPVDYEAAKKLMESEP